MCVCVCVCEPLKLGTGTLVPVRYDVAVRTSVVLCFDIVRCRYRTCCINFFSSFIHVPVPGIIFKKFS